MRRVVSSAVVGFVFAIGLGVSGMTDANKVLAFLNVAGDWDPSLALVMAAAIAVYAPVYALYRRTGGPLLGGQCAIPTSRALDAKLLGGAVLFGAGWGLGGYCPGPGLIGAVSGAAQPLVFVAALAVGMWLHQATSAAARTIPKASGEDLVA